jgi:hypothetical protein
MPSPDEAQHWDDVGGHAAELDRLGLLMAELRAKYPDHQTGVHCPGCPTNRLHNREDTDENGRCAECAEAYEAWMN